ncbi:MAG: porin family protein [Bacteroidia bacterium]|nr:porin family protein [Bacteroidia bacterium]
MKSRLFFKLVTVFAFFTGIYTNAQDVVKSEGLTDFDRLVFYDFRGTNAFNVSGGLASISSDYDNSEFKFQFKAGYKRFLSNYLNLNLSVGSFKLANTDLFEDQYTSIDLNIEFLLSPYERFSPFAYGGYGIVSAKDIDTSAGKVQAGLGAEYIVYDGLAIKLYAEYNYTTSDELEGVIGDTGNDSFLRFGLGLNVYFGGEEQRNKLLENQDTVIKSNQIIIDN